MRWIHLVLVVLQGCKEDNAGKLLYVKLHICTIISCTVISMQIWRRSWRQISLWCRLYPLSTCTKDCTVSTAKAKIMWLKSLEWSHWSLTWYIQASRFPGQLCLLRTGNLEIPLFDNWSAWLHQSLRLYELSAIKCHVFLILHPSILQEILKGPRRVLMPVPLASNCLIL